MKVEALSASRIKTYQQCAMRYYAQYELKLPEDTPHPLTRMGSCIHRMFENATNARTAGNLEGYDPLTYKAAAMKEYDVDPSLESLVDELTKNAIQWGYFRNIARTVGCEVEFKFTLESGVPVRGFIDRLDLNVPEADIIDLKTQKNAFEGDELTNNWQARIYNAAVRKLYPDVKGIVTVSFWVLRHMVQKVHLTADDATQVLVDMDKVVKEIEACSEPQGSPSGLCGYCLYEDQCPTINQSVRTRMKRK